MANITGINVEGIPKLRTALEEYMKSINDFKIDLVGKELHKALKGTSTVGEFTKLSQACNSRKENLLNLIKKCEESLTGIEQEYMKNDETSTAVSEQKSAIDKLKS